MCELFAMCSRFPADVHFSLEAFSRRGGLGGRLKDGWGLAYYVEEDVRLVKEPEPAADSACVAFIQDHPFTSTTVLSHIRRATRGAPAMKNCQPFQRELGGRVHVFAHNGNLDIEALRARLPLENFHPVGETDSEHAFCGLLERLRALWLRPQQPPLNTRREVVARFAEEIRVMGPANFIYSDGDALFIHGHKRIHDDSAAPHPPGLHLLCRRCAQSNVAGVSAEGLSITLEANQEVVLAASVPLTEEPGWRVLAEGELVVARHGHIAEMPRTRVASLLSAEGTTLKSGG